MSTPINRFCIDDNAVPPIMIYATEYIFNLYNCYSILNSDVFCLMLWHMKSEELLTLLGAQIRTLRKARGITQERLAELADINLSYMSEIERGQANVSLCIVNQIANALGVTITGLFEASGAGGFENLEVPDLFREAEKLDDKKLAIFVAVVQGLLNGLQRV